MDKTKTSKVVAIVEARMGSSRLPGKVLADIQGKPALMRLISRLRFCKELDEIVVAPYHDVELKPAYKEKVIFIGDAAHAMPVMNKLVEQAKNLDFKILYRDENKELMNRFLTNGTMSIPKLIAFDNETQEVINDWGPSPLMIMNKTKDFKAANATLTTEFKKEIQIWYNQNKGKCIARDLLKLIE